MSLRGLYYVYVTGFLGGKQKMKKFLKNFFGFKKSLTYSARDEKKIRKYLLSLPSKTRSDLQSHT